MSANSFSVGGNGSTCVRSFDFSSTVIFCRNSGSAPSVMAILFPSGGPESCELFSRPVVMGMDRAHKTRIVRSTYMPHLDRIAGIRDRSPDQGLLHRASCAIVGAR